MNSYDSLDSLIGASVGVMVFATFIYALIMIAFLVAVYIIYCFPQKAVANKVGLYSDWMAYVPVARSVQKADIAQMSLWKFLFLGSFTPSLFAFFVSLLPLLMIFAVPESAPVMLIIMILLLLAVMVMSIICNYQYNHILCKMFGFNTFLAFAMLFIPLNGIIFNFLIVYSDKFKPGDEYIEPESPNISGAPNSSNSGSFVPGFVGRDGIYASQRFDLPLNETVVLGRDKMQCSIVFPGECTKVSRVHCSVRFDTNQNTYVITDMSSNGTYVNGMRISVNVPYNASSGSIIALGNNSNTFTLL